MQNRYEGDVGDFGKYGLLRAICEDSNLKLGVNWYLVPDEGHNNDGKFTNYLSPDKVREFRPCDTELYDELRTMIYENTRSIKEVQDRHILPLSTIFYDKPLSFSSDNKLIHKRNIWHDEALESLLGCDIVFLDPDNGLEVKSYTKASSASKKYVFYDEIPAYYERGQSLIIYNHRDRKPEDEYIKRFMKIKEYVYDVGDMFYLRFNRFSVRDYVFVLQPEHLEVVRESVEALVNGPWVRNFSIHNMV